MDIFTPLEFGTWKLPNRIIMGSMHIGLEEKKGGFDKLAEFYQERASGGVSLIITGGFSPNLEGGLKPFSGQMKYFVPLKEHKKITNAVHNANSKIVMQLLHAGRYGFHPFIVSASDIKSPITPFKPRKMSKANILSTIEDFANAALKAKEANYDGVEIMGSEGYLINQFLTHATNKRNDEWSDGTKFALDIVNAIRNKVGKDFIIIFRLSLLELIPDGLRLQDGLNLGVELEKAGVNIINTGIGWHQSRVPTIATCVPPGAYAPITKKLKNLVNIPVVAVNRINTPDIANKIIQNGYADLVSLARPLLADSQFVIKAKQNRSNEINTCIACNQSCLDRIFKNKIASCLVNPRAGFELEFPLPTLTQKVEVIKKILVVGAGPAGLMASLTLAKRGHNITLAESTDKIGGQFLLAKKIPGKEDFAHTIRYFETQFNKYNVKVLLKTTVNSFYAQSQGFDEIIIATGLKPRKIHIKGIDAPHVFTYQEVISQDLKLGNNIAIIGAGGIGFDVASFVLNNNKNFFEEWKIDETFPENLPGGLIQDVPVETKKDTSIKNIYLCQRKKGKLGETLGKTTGWIHRNYLKNNGVNFLDDLEYLEITPTHFIIKKDGQQHSLAIDNVIICAGLESNNHLENELNKANIKFHSIGGAKKAQESDAQIAFRDGFNIGMKL